jgi:hypothetical protein
MKFWFEFFLSHVIDLFFTLFKPCSSPKSGEDTSDGVTFDDLHHLYKLVEEKDGGLPWIQMMDKSTPTMSYQAWRREPKVSYILFLFR